MNNGGNEGRRKGGGEEIERRWRADVIGEGFRGKQKEERKKK